MHTQKVSVQKKKEGFRVSQTFLFEIRNEK